MSKKYYYPVTREQMDTHLIFLFPELSIDSVAYIKLYRFVRREYFRFGKSVLCAEGPLKNESFVQLLEDLGLPNPGTKISIITETSVFQANHYDYPFDKVYEREVPELYLKLRDSALS